MNRVKGLGSTLSFDEEKKKVKILLNRLMDKKVQSLAIPFAVEEGWGCTILICGTFAQFYVLKSLALLRDDDTFCVHIFSIVTTSSMDY